MKKIILIFALLLLAGCDEQRDLYVRVPSTIVVEGDWMPSLGLSDMTMNATAVAYNASGQAAMSYFSRANSTSLSLQRGTYDIMIFNGLMYSETETHLDDIFFRNTGQIGTFEAVAAEATPSKRLARAEDEYIASNNMELFTSAVQELAVVGDNGYYVKYVDGENGTDIPPSYVEAEIALTPVAMNFKCQVIGTFDNISSAWSASAALHGFVGSAFVHTRTPSHFYATHQFILNSKRMLPGYEDRGTIESPVFITFGPPVDVADKTYSVFVSITLGDGTKWEETVDVTDQVVPVIEKIKQNIAGTAHEQITITIYIDLGLHELPVIEFHDGSIGVGDWEDDEIIHVPIRP